MESVTLDWWQMEWMEVGCVRRLVWQPGRNLRRQTQQDRSWGKGRGCFMLERRGWVQHYGVCSFSYASWCSTFLWSSLRIRKLHLWYCVFGTTLGQNLKKPLEISSWVLKAKGHLLAVKFLGLSYCSLLDRSPALGFTGRSLFQENPDFAFQGKAVAVTVKHLMILDCRV